MPAKTNTVINFNCFMVASSPVDFKNLTTEITEKNSIKISFIITKLNTSLNAFAVTPLFPPLQRGDVRGVFEKRLQA
jgi:hypothetical protein